MAVHPLHQWYGMPFGLVTDLYELTMAHGYWKKGWYNRRAVFHLSFRKQPFAGDFSMACGLDLAVAFLQNWRFDPADIQYLGSLRDANGFSLLEEGFLNYLQRTKFSCNVDAIPEGNVVFPNEPLLRVEGPLIQAQLFETALLNLVSFSTLVATKAARIVRAAKGDEVVEMGLRRAQGFNGGITATRSAYIGGCLGTSNVLAGRLFGIPLRGSHAHSWVQTFDDELSAFRSYAEQQPDNCIFLVDTYDSIQGIRNAIQVGHELKTRGHDLAGIRLDSGDLVVLAKEARKMLDKAGFRKTVIMASNDLDEYSIYELKQNKAPIDVWGVGTRMVTAYDQPALGGVYKLSAIQNEKGEWEPSIKKSNQAIKTSIPGILQVKRLYKKGKPVGDAIVDELSPFEKLRIRDFKTNQPIDLNYSEEEPLLQPIFREGEYVYKAADLAGIRQFGMEQSQLFEKVNAENYPVGLELCLAGKRTELLNER